MTQRVSPPASGFYNPITIDKVQYSGAVNGTIDVPDHIGATMKANGWMVCSDNGADISANRPVPTKIGQTYLDTTLGYTIKWDGKVWRNPSNGAAV